MSVVLAACDAERAGPADTARAWFEAMAGLDLRRVKTLTCNADNQAIANALIASGGLSGEFDLSRLQAQVRLDLSGLNYEEKEASRDEAIVRVWGSLNGQPVDQEVRLLNEGDVWKVCTSSLSGRR